MIVIVSHQIASCQKFRYSRSHFANANGWLNLACLLSLWKAKCTEADAETKWLRGMLF